MSRGLVFSRKMARRYCVLSGMKPMPALMLVLLAFALLPAAQVSANGIHVGSREVFSGPVGPYDMRVETAPAVGTLHMVVYVNSIEDGSPVADANIQVSGSGPAESPQSVGPVSGTPSLAGPGIYSVDVRVGEAGEWTFTMTIDSAMGEATVRMLVSVQKGNGFDWTIGLIVGLVMFPLLAWYIRKTLRRRGLPIP